MNWIVIKTLGKHLLSSYLNGHLDSHNPRETENLVIADEDKKSKREKVERSGVYGQEKEKTTLTQNRNHKDNFGEGDYKMIETTLAVDKNNSPIEKSDDTTKDLSIENKNTVEVISKKGVIDSSEHGLKQLNDNQDMAWKNAGLIHDDNAFNHCHNIG